jgi:hypothetical protein
MEINDWIFAPQVVLLILSRVNNVLVSFYKN